MPRRSTILAGLYVAALAASHVVRLGHEDEHAIANDTRVHLLTEATAADRPSRRAVRLAYLELRPDSSGPPAVVIHGSPGSKADVAPFARALASRRRVLVPDLPGSGESTLRVADYSYPAQAHYVLALMNASGIRRAHLVGFSMGGGVVLTAAARFPNRVASVSLVSAIGVQEMELFGDCHVNHVVHGVQLLSLWLLREGTPHFGWLDDMMIGVPYARTFYYSDQRPLRRALTSLQMPVLIVHGSRDRMVPVEAAREHARLVPQSEFTLIDSDHFAIVRDPAGIATLVSRFLERVDAGRALVRQTAAAARLQAAAAPFDPQSVPPAGPAARFVLMVALAAATFGSEDLTCIVAGMLVAHAQIGFLGAVFGCFAGILAGDLGLFLAGRAIGRPIVRRWPISRLVTAERLDRSAAWLRDHGARVILASRFLPGSRLPTYVAAGVLGLGVRKYVRWFAVSAAVWTPLVVGGSALATRSSLTLMPRHGLAAGAVLLLLLLIALRGTVMLVSHDGRRRLVSGWRRLTRWEFWPPWLFYAPVMGSIVLLMLRHRSATVFTAANPGMPAGGFIGESKSDILRALVDRGAPVAPFIVLRADESADHRAGVARRFACVHGLPLVLKPDQGQRGSGVRILRSLAVVDEAVRAIGSDTILQAYVGGREFGVFYARRRDDPCGRIVSLTAKDLATVVGDGKRTLERLIVDDPRAVALADVYRAANADRLGTVPPAGAVVTICELGTHCRGAIFRNAIDVRTPALEQATERSARAMAGFSFGRFDVRAESVEAMREGQFVILELNGVTSEPTHIYDRTCTLLCAWRTLIGAWRLAFAIGSEHAREGARVWTIRELIGLVQAHRRFARAASGSPKPEGDGHSRSLTGPQPGVAASAPR